MGSRDVEKLLSGMSLESKKEFLDGLVISILHDLNEDEEKDLLRTVVVGQKENQHLSSMVEY